VTPLAVNDVVMTDFTLGTSVGLSQPQDHRKYLFAGKGWFDIAMDGPLTGVD
jgi:hypothetical protein